LDSIAASVEPLTTIICQRAWPNLHLAVNACAAADYQATGHNLLSVLALLDEVPLAGVGSDERLVMGQIIDTVLTVFCLPDFVVAEEQGFLFLRYNVLIANLMDGCLQTTTDHHIIKVQQHTQAAFKTLVLYSARNNQSVDIASLLVANPDLVSRWLFQTWKVIFSGNCSQKVTANLQRFLSQMDHRILPAIDMQELYFGCTYPGFPEERRAKELINQAIQKHIPLQIENRPVPDRIAVFSEYWSKGHSVHRTLAQYIAALKPHCHLTLLHSLRESEDLDTSLFDDVIRIPFNGASLDLSSISPNQFSVMIFPDVGMTLPSILMVNLRCAPVQVMMTGHPVSTFGAKVDYFISGRDVDVPMLAPQMYSERLVLLPGYGAVHELPTMPRQFRQKTAPEVIINCSWYGQKIHWHWLETVNAAIKRCRSRVRLRVFAGQAPINHKGYPAFLNEVSRVITAAWTEVVPHLAYPDYMALMEEGDFAIDCYPFAGSNTVADNLYLRKPTLAREGFRWFNRIGPAMLRSAGLAELIAGSDQEYSDQLVKLVDDQQYRQRFVDILADADLERTVFHPQGAPEFAQFIRNLSRDPHCYPGRDPIVL
jgi:hypothetical protein